MDLPSFKEFLKLEDQKDKNDKKNSFGDEDDEPIPEKAKKAKIDIYT